MHSTSRSISATAAVAASPKSAGSEPKSRSSSIATATNSVYSPRKLPGPARYGNVTLKRGSLPADDQLWSWIDAAIQGSPEPRDVTVLLLNTDHEPVRAWRLRNAWPAAYEVSRFDAKAAKIAIESLELAHEGLALLDL